eukprot:scaffold76601_cov51-Phaeocystis_antarctica.AAC.1
MPRSHEHGISPADLQQHSATQCTPPHRPLRGRVPLRAREAATVASASASANFALRLSWAGWKLFLRRSGWCPRDHCDDR